MTVIRDFFRRRRVNKHLRTHGRTFTYQGLSISMPEEADLALLNALLKGKYEAEEAALIQAHMPPDQAVIELGGSMGVVSAYIGSQLKTLTCANVQLGRY